MSIQLGRVVSEILNRYFGEIVQKVGSDLYTYGSRPIAVICKSTGLPRTKVVESLRTLLKFDLASFEPSASGVAADYKLIHENVLLLLRYPRYLLQIKSKFGTEAELMIEELLQKSISTASMLLISIATKYKDDKEKNITIVKLKAVFESLATAGYIQQAPVAELKDGAEVPVLVPVATIVPDLKVRPLVEALNNNSTNDISDNVYWKVNFDRFHQDFRDQLMIQAVTRRIDENAGELMRLLLQLMYLTSPEWTAESNPVSALDLKESCNKLAADKPLLIQHLDQYLKVLEENGCGFIRRTDDSSNGQFVVNLRLAAEKLSEAALNHTITERLGSKAARVFRLIQSRKYMEEEDIQKHAMLPNKECKELTYKLMEEHFISVQPMRKAASAGGMAKTIYLYHIKLYEATQTLREMCYRALQNILRVVSQEQTNHAHLLHKQRRVRSIVHGMQARNEPEDNITDVEDTITSPERTLLATVERRLKRLSTAELQLDNTLFILNWYDRYR